MSFRRERRLDWLLLGALLPVAVTFLALFTWWGATNAAYVPFWVAPAAGPDDFPEVSFVDPKVAFEGAPLVLGDRLLSVGDTSLRGARAPDLLVALYRLLARDGGGISFEAQRGEVRVSSTASRLTLTTYWVFLPFGAGLLVVATVLLLRAPQWPLRRRTFVCLVAYSMLLLRLMPPGQVLTDVRTAEAFLVFYWLMSALAFALSLSISWGYGAPEGQPQPLVLRWAVWLVGFGTFGLYLAELVTDRVTAGRLIQLHGAAAVLVWGAALAGLTLRYRRLDALERRKGRWILYGTYVGALPEILSVAAFALGSTLPNQNAVLAVRALALAAIPAGFFVAVIGYHWLDIDRLISATASYTILGVVLLGFALQVIPRVAQAASAAVGVPPSTGQWVLTLLFAGTVVQGHRWLRPWLDRQMFAERVAVENGLARLVAELADCRSADELTRRSAEGIDRLLRPESIVVYAREGDAFVPVYARAQATPAAFPGDGLLARALEARSTALAANDAALGPFDRAALETLGAEVVTPTRRGTALAAFTCLGPKRSGDIYTRDRSGAVQRAGERDCESCSASASGDAPPGARDAGGLRRYVPGAVADQLASGPRSAGRRARGHGAVRRSARLHELRREARRPRRSSRP